MSHTPGPWKTVIANYSEDNISWLASADVVTPRGATLVRFEGTQDYQKNNEHEANASLIAAAPEMLEALEWLMEYLKRSTLGTVATEYGGKATLVDRLLLEVKMRDVIEKARGQS